MNSSTNFEHLVWNYQPGTLELAPQVVIHAVLRIGTWEQMMWLFKYYGTERVKEEIKRDYFGARSLPVSIRTFWGNVFWPDSPPPELSDPMERWRPSRLKGMGASLEVQTRLRAALESSGLSQSAFASFLGTSQPRLSNYLAGKTMPSAKLLVQAENLAEMFKQIT